MSNNLKSQKGFSAIGLFLLGLVMLFIMGASGLFDIPKSEVEDDKRYQAKSSKEIEGKGLQISDLEFITPIPEPEEEKRPPDTKYCLSDSGKKIEPGECECPVISIRCQGGKATEMGGQPNPYPYNDKWCNPPNPTEDGLYCVGKPVIYLYPEFPMLVDVRVVTAGDVVISDPQIEKGFASPNSPAGEEGGWTDVMAHPNGVLFYKDRPYRELFYETKTRKVNPPEKGLVIKKENLEYELLEFIQKLGLNRHDEQKEFMDWWVPRLQALNSPYLFVSILENAEKQRLDQVTINPKPDTFIEFIAYFKPLEAFEKIEPLILPPTPKRYGFTAVEWGGVIEKAL